MGRGRAGIIDERTDERFRAVLGVRRGVPPDPAVLAGTTGLAQVRGRLAFVLGGLSEHSPEEAAAIAACIESAFVKLQSGRDPREDAEPISVTRSEAAGVGGSYRSTVEELIANRGAGGLAGALTLCYQDEAALGDSNIGERYDVRATQRSNIALQLAWLFANHWEWLSDILFDEGAGYAGPQNL